MARCAKHSFESAAAQCRMCGEPFCSDCLVYTYGPSKPPYCVPCALVAAGVRRVSGAAKKAMKSGRSQTIEINPGAPSRTTLVVGGASPDADALEPEAVVAEDDPPAPGRRGRSVVVAWVAVAAGVVLVAVPFVTNV